MSIDGWTTMGVIVAMAIAMAWNIAGPDIILVAGVTVLLAAGVLTPEEAFVGFSNPAIITIGALFVVAAGIRETGALDLIGRTVLGTPRNLPGAQMRMMFPVAALSAFINNTPVVAMFAPLVTDWARRCKLSISMLLLPLSYAAILGGTCTLIGTSTNLVVAGLAEKWAAQHGMKIQFPMFEIGLIGIPVMTLGIFFVVVASRFLLKDRRGSVNALGRAREYTITMRIEKGSPVVGKTIETAGLRSLEGLFLYEIEREGETLVAVPPSTVLREDDRLRFAGVVESVVDLRRMRIVLDTDQLENSKAAPIVCLLKPSFRRNRRSLEKACGKHDSERSTTPPCSPFIDKEYASRRKKLAISYFIRAMYCYLKRALTLCPIGSEIPTLHS
ncbi:MAG: SLC13 family permease [Polyangiales bacterium]